MCMLTDWLARCWLAASPPHLHATQVHRAGSVGGAGAPGPSLLKAVALECAMSQQMSQAYTMTTADLATILETAEKPKSQAGTKRGQVSSVGVRRQRRQAPGTMPTDMLRLCRV